MTIKPSLHPAVPRCGIGGIDRQKILRGIGDLRITIIPQKCSTPHSEEPEASKRIGEALGGRVDHSVVQDAKDNLAPLDKNVNDSIQNLISSGVDNPCKGAYI